MNNVAYTELLTELMKQINSGGLAWPRFYLVYQLRQLPWITTTEAAVPHWRPYPSADSVSARHTKQRNMKWN